MQPTEVISEVKSHMKGQKIKIIKNMFWVSSLLGSENSFSRKFTLVYVKKLSGKK